MWSGGRVFGVEGAGCSYELNEGPDEEEGSRNGQADMVLCDTAAVTRHGCITFSSRGDWSSTWMRI